MDSLGSPDISIFNNMNIFFSRNLAVNMIVSLFMAKKISVLNQVLKRIAYLQKDKHGPV